MTPELVDFLNLAVTIPGGLTGFGGIGWIMRRMQADKLNDKCHDKEIAAIRLEYRRQSM